MTELLAKARHRVKVGDPPLRQERHEARSLVREGSTSDVDTDEQDAVLLSHQIVPDDTLAMAGGTDVSRESQ